MGARALFGRRVIYTDVAEINAGNIIDVLQKALFVHLQNSADIDYLYRYYRGDQPVLYREKEVRPEICNKVVENRANEIVSFKVGYLMGEPVQYVSRSDDENISAEVSRLNDYVLSEDKPAKDKELADWSHIGGTSYRMVLPDGEADVEEDEAPFEIFTLDPRFAFVVYSTALGNPAMMGVKYVKDENGNLIFSCYTRDHYYEVENTWAIIRSEPQILGIPIIEYPANKARLGAFEIVLPLLDAINTVESNRLDGVEQFVQALMLFHNVDINTEDFRQLRDEGAIKYKDIDPQFKAEIEYLDKDYAAAMESFKHLQAVAENPENKEAAKLGLMRCAELTGQPQEALLAANDLLKEPKLSPEIMSEARYVRAKAYISLKQENKALADLKEISKDTRTIHGAEAKYLLAQLYYDNKDDKNAETVLMNFIENGTPHQYWLARGFILLADIYIRQGDDFQARQYLTSLQNNYKGDDEIAAMIEDRLGKLKK